MEHHRSSAAAEQTAALLRLSLQLRDAAADADRQDVVAKVDDLMSLIAGERIPVDGGSPKTGPGAAETVQRILNGLGY
ncbi:hypothetical protein ACWKSP_00210 [Micromonosporaceae bacterium Da 78-11]